MALEVLPATAERFDDVATLLGRSDKACWCLYWRLASRSTTGFLTGQPGCASCSRVIRRQDCSLTWTERWSAGAGWVLVPKWAA